MAEAGLFVGSALDASKEAINGLGSLVEVQEEEQVTVCHVVGTASTEIIQLSDASSRLFIRVERDATADIAVRLGGGANHVLEVILEAGATCSIVHISDGEIAITQRMQVEEGVTVRLSNITLGSGVTHDVSSRCIGAHAQSNIDCMFYAKGADKQHLNARNVFDAPDGGGEILMRGIAEGKGHAECKGLIEIGLQGGGTNTYLTQEVLMLDSTAKVDAIPALEIKTNDVKASHSATVARITEEDLFYFGARGIAPEEARRLFILGFLGSITERIVHDEARGLILEEIEKKFAS